MHERRFGPWRREARSFLELFALCGVAIAQPAFDLLTKNAELLVSLRTTEFEAVVFTLVVLLVPPAALWLVEAAVGFIAPRFRRPTHALLAGGVVAVLAAEALKHQTDLGRGALVLAAGLAAIASALLLLRFEVVGMWLRFLAIAPPIFALLFLLSSGVTSAVFDDGPAATRAEVKRPARVVMIVLDELPLMSMLDGNGRIDATLFPNLAALAGESTWYRNTTTVGQSTQQAVPSLVSGAYPTDLDALPVASAHPRNLFTLLGGRYDMNVHETLTRLCPDSMCVSVEAPDRRRGFVALLGDVVELWRDFASPLRETAPTTYNPSESAGDQLAATDAFVQSLTPAAGPRLDFFHLVLPHQPWRLRAGLRDDGARGQVNYKGWPDDEAARNARQRHLLQLQATDELVGEIIAKLRRIGAYRDSLLVLAADHGVAFTAGVNQRVVGTANWQQILWVPLIVKAPRQGEGGIDDRPATLIDVLPTIADTLRVRLPWSVDGRSLLKAPRPDGERRVYRWSEQEASAGSGRYVEFDGPTGFATVQRAAASTAGGDPAWRLYRTGPFGELVGQRAAPLVDQNAPPSVGRISDRRAFRRVDADSRDISWAFVHGNVRAAPGQPVAVAVAVNGVVAGMATMVPAPPDAPRRFYSATLAPQTFVDGANDVRLFLVSGSPEAPRLVPVRLPG